MTMTPAGVVPHVPAVAPSPSTLARATSLTASRSRCDRRASLSRIARAKIAASTRAGAPAVMRHGTDEACVPGHRAMDGHVIGRIAGARLEDGSPHGPRHAGADRVVALFVRRRQEYVPVISTPVRWHGGFVDHRSQYTRPAIERISDASRHRCHGQHRLALLERLHTQGRNVGALLRDASRADSLPDGIDIAVGNLDDPDSLTSALRGIKSVFLVNEMFRTRLVGQLSDDVENPTGVAPRMFREWCEHHFDELR
jgi:hypothetical protein